MGIRGQLALVVPAIVGLTLMGLGIGAAEQRRRDETHDMRDRNERVLEAIGVTVAVYVAENDMAGLDTLVAHLSQDRRYPDLRELEVLDADGRIIAHSTPERFGTLPGDAFTRRAVGADAPVWAREGAILRVGVPAISGLRWATVVASYSLDRLDRSVAATRYRWMLLATFLGLALGLALSLGLQRLVVGPVRLLRDVARRMGEGDLNARVPPLNGRELAELAETFNKMAATLKAEREGLEHAVAERTRELREANGRLEKLAVTDGLTGLYNHRRFQETLVQEVARAARVDRPMAVLMVDVDHFKRFNDSMGHPAGDELLRRLAQVLSGELRGTDFLSRYGGEEFGLILPDTGKPEALQAAERLREAVDRELNKPGEFKQKVSVSIGVASFKIDGDAAQTLLSAADKALYVAKHRGRNQVAAAGAEAA
ncbi:MAG: GGDEF domain-containing protein [Myxococcaceae bacterium]